MTETDEDAPHILVVDDDARLRQLLHRYLLQNGYFATTAADAAEAKARAKSIAFDLIVLDIMMPGQDGLSLTEELRGESEVPILLLTARGAPEDRIRGLEAGADDYLAKPFHMEELLARLRALIRRAQGLASPRLRCGPLELDTRSGEVTVAGRPVSLTAHEYRLLAYLMHRPGQLVSRGELTEHLYAQDFDRDSNTIEVFVARLRRKLPAELIETVRGRGYRLQARA